MDLGPVVSRLRYDPALPISDHRQEILAALASHPVLVVAGETGSGKTTQLPKLCLEAGRGARGLIGHTQPRRLAARTVAERLAEEIEVPLGGLVGYQVRHTDQLGPDTVVKVMTDGILLAEIRRDRQLRRYDTLIIDEAHERSLNIDFLLGYVKGLLRRRDDLTVVITSATIDTARFAAHFDQAPVVEVSGRTYPVEVRHRAPEDPEAGWEDPVLAVSDAVAELIGEGPGDILVFLSGEREIRDTAEGLRALGLPDTEVLPLYARLSVAEQHRAFRPHSGRRVVLATNVAETSLTVPGIRYVIDLGTARISRYNRRTKVQRLPIEAVSRASADQRAGRCGRLGPGICIRLYSEEDYEARPRFTEPEILRTNLASVILQMTASGLGEVAGFPFLDPPDSAAVRDGLSLLEELQAFDVVGPEQKRLSRIGRKLAQIPLDPRLARMLIAAGDYGAVREVTIITAALSIQDPRERPTGKEQEADASHRRFVDPASDLMAYLELWRYLQQLQREVSASQFRRRCRAEFLSYLRIREWQDLVGQLRLVARDMGLRPAAEAASPEAVHRAILSGLLSQVGSWDANRREYFGTRQSRFAIAPGSALFRRSPRWVMAADLVETTRLWARNVATVRPEWIEAQARHLLKRNHGEPVWDAVRGAAQVPERVTLYGLTLVSARRVDYSRIDAADARALFIRHGLVEADWERRPPIVDENLDRRADLAGLEDRLRRRDIVCDDDALFELYDRRLPEVITSGPAFERWWRKQAPPRREQLRFGPQELLRTGTAEVDLEGFPDRWSSGDLALELEYRFEPGEDDDGVTVVVPIEALNQLSPAEFQWHIAGWRADLVTSLIRSLPKAARRQLVPASEHALAFLSQYGPADGPLLDSLARFLTRAGGTVVQPADFNPSALSPHLRLAFRVVDADGSTLAFGRDLAPIKADLQGAMQDALGRTTGLKPVSGATSWVFGTIPKIVERRTDGSLLRGYPSLVDEGEAVGLRVLTGPEAQAGHMWAGTRRLLLLGLPSAHADLERRLPRPVKLTLATSPGGAQAALIDCVASSLDSLVADLGGPPWDEAGFAALLKVARADLAARGAETARAMAGVLTAAAELRRRAGELRAERLRAALYDIDTQLEALLAPGFATRFGTGRLADIERYVRAAHRRLEKLPEDPQRDAARMSLVHDLQRSLEDAASRGASATSLNAIRWMIEELRVQLWAQTLGTSEPVSERRVRRAIDEAVSAAEPESALARAQDGR